MISKIFGFLLFVAIAATPFVSTASGTGQIAGNVVEWGYIIGSDDESPSLTIAAGSYHSLALKVDGTVAGWGWNDYGQATPPDNLSDVVTIAAGGRHSLALKADGTVVGWGANYYGQAIPRDNLSDVVAIAAGYEHSLALKADGTVVRWGGVYYTGPTILPPPDNLSDVVAIAAGDYHSLALKADGMVVGWGWNNYGQATPPANLDNVVAIAAGFYHSLALKADGTVIGWGYNYYGQATPPINLCNVVAIAAGGEHSLALKADGTVVGWGYNYYGQATPRINLCDVVAIAAGGFHSLAIVAHTVPPVITAPADVTANTEPGQCGVSGLALGEPIVNDNDGVASVVNNAPDVFPIGTTLVTWTATDFLGNTSAATQKVTVLETWFRIFGSAYNVPQDLYRVSFSMDAAGRCSSPNGWLKYYYTRTRLNFVSTAINEIVATEGAATIHGAGTINGAGGYTFTATVTDGLTDSFGITIKKPDGGVYYTTGPRPLSSGDLKISKMED